VKTNSEADYKMNLLIAWSCWCD